MAIDKELLEILACPKCKGDIRLVEKSTTHGEDGLICEKCWLLFPIREGIPVMLINEAIPLNKNER